MGLSMLPKTISPGENRLFGVINVTSVHNTIILWYLPFVDEPIDATL